MRRRAELGVALATVLMALVLGCAKKAAPPPGTMPAEVRAAIGDWMTLVQHALPGTTADSMVYEGRRRMHRDYVWIHEPLPKAMDDSSSALEPGWSPDGRHWLEPNMYREIGPSGQDPTRLAGGYDVDSAPLIGNAEGDTIVRLEFTGPSGRYEDARWLDANRFLLFANFEREIPEGSEKRWWSWYVRLYDLRDSSIVVWATRDSADELAYGRYAAAIDSFVLAQHVAWTRAVSRR